MPGVVHGVLRAPKKDSAKGAQRTLRVTATSESITATTMPLPLRENFTRYWGKKKLARIASLGLQPAGHIQLCYLRVRGYFGQRPWLVRLWCVRPGSARHTSVRRLLPKRAVAVRKHSLQAAFQKGVGRAKGFDDFFAVGFNVGLAQGFVKLDFQPFFLLHFRQQLRLPWGCRFGRGFLTAALRLPCIQ